MATDPKTPAKRTRRSDSTIEHEFDEAPVMEDMIVQDDAGEEEEETKVIDSKTNIKPETKMEVDEGQKSNRKREIKDETESSEPKKACLDKENKNDEDTKVDVNTDAEDSINLDIGDDELLNEEVCFYFFSVSVKLPSATSKMSNGFMMEID